jgi:hypothetical protein
LAARRQLNTKKWRKEVEELSNKQTANTNIGKASIAIAKAQLKSYEDQVEKLEKLKRSELERVGFFNKSKKAEEAKGKRDQDAIDKAKALTKQQKELIIADLEQAAALKRSQAVEEKRNENYDKYKDLISEAIELERKAGVERGKLSEVTGVVATANQDAANSVADLNDEYDELTGTTSTAAEGFAKFAGVFEQVSGQISAVLGTVANFADLAFSGVIDSINKEIDDVQTRLEETLSNLEKAQDAEQARLDENLERELERLGLQDETKEQVFEREKERLDEQLEKQGLTYDQIRTLDDEQLASTLEKLGLRNQAESIQLQADQIREAEGAALIEDTNAQKVQSEEDYLAAVEQAEKEAAVKTAKLEYEAALAEWKQRKTKAVIDTITGSLAAFTSAMNLPFPANLIAGAAAATAATAFGVAQTVAISKNKPQLQIPSFDVGSFDVPSDTMAQVHEGEIIVPKKFSDSVREGEAVITGKKDPGMATGGTQKPLIVQIDGKQFFKILFDASASGELIVSDQALVVT